MISILYSKDLIYMFKLLFFVCSLFTQHTHGIFTPNHPQKSLVSQALLKSLITTKRVLAFAGRRLSATVALPSPTTSSR